MKLRNLLRLFLLMVFILIGSSLNAEDIPIERASQRLTYNFSHQQICFQARSELLQLARNIGVRFTVFTCDYRASEMEFDYYRPAESSETLGYRQPYRHTVFLNTPYCYQIAESIDFFLNILPLENFSSAVFCNPRGYSSLTYEFDYLVKKEPKHD